MRKVIYIILMIGFIAAVLRLLEEEAAREALQDRLDRIRKQEQRTGDVEPGRELGDYYDCD